MSKRVDIPVNDKRTMTKDDWPGWYQITFCHSGKLSAGCRWWNGKEWNSSPNVRHGCSTEDLGDVRGIVHLVEA